MDYLIYLCMLRDAEIDAQQELERAKQRRGELESCGDSCVPFGSRVSAVKVANAGFSSLTN